MAVNETLALGLFSGRLILIDISQTNKEMFKIEIISVQNVAASWVRFSPKALELHLSQVQVSV